MSDQEIKSGIKIRKKREQKLNSVQILETVCISCDVVVDKPKGNFRSRLINAQKQRAINFPKYNLYSLSGEGTGKRLGGRLKVLRKSLQRFRVDCI